MPYQAPFKHMNAIQDKLIIFADGSVSLDGDVIGWIEQINIEPRWTHDARHHKMPDEHRIYFHVYVTAQKTEPDAVYDLGGKKVGHLNSDGGITKIPTTP